MFKMIARTMCMVVYFKTPEKKTPIVLDKISAEEYC